MMFRRILFSAALLWMLALIAGCEPVADSGAADVTTSEAPAPESESQLALTVAQSAQLSEEIRILRDRIETLEFELEETRSDQRRQYDDLDARLRKFERPAAPAMQAVPPAGAGAELPQPVPEPAPDMTAPTAPPAPGDETTEAVPDSMPAADPVAAREAYDSAFRLLRQGKYEDSIVAFENIIAAYPDSELIDDSWYWIAEANYVTQNYATALPIFERMIRDYPDNQRASEAMLKIGYIHYDLSNFQDAEKYLREVMDAYPASRSAFSARRRLDKMAREGNLSSN